MFVFLKPAYGRIYKTAFESLQEYNNGKDFILCDDNWRSGPYCSRRDFDKQDLMICIKYQGGHVFFTSLADSNYKISEFFTSDIAAPQDKEFEIKFQEGHGHD